MTKKLLVFQHTTWEGPGKLLLDSANEHHTALKVVKVWKQPIPDLSHYDGLLVLGGGPNIDQERQYPFLVHEKRAIRQAIAEKRPYLGFCLGHQLLAEALGAEVGPNFRASVGFVTGHQTHDGREHPAFAGLPAKMKLFKWHSQAVKEPLPRHVTILATSADSVVEAISLDNYPNIVGVQYDNHAAAPEDVRRWLVRDKKWLTALPDIKVDPEEVLAASQKYQAEVTEQFARFFANFLAMVP